MNNHVINQRLQTLRSENKLTTEKMGHELGGIPTSTMGTYLKDREPDLDTIIRASEYFGVSIEWLLGLSDIRKEEHVNRSSNIEKKCGISDNSRLTGKNLEHFNRIQTQLDHIAEEVYIILSLHQGSEQPDDSLPEETESFIRKICQFFSDIQRCLNSKPELSKDELSIIERYIRSTGSRRNTIFEKYNMLVSKYGELLAEVNDSISPQDKLTLKLAFKLLTNSKTAGSRSSRLKDL